VSALDRLSEIRARLAAATPGPWRRDFRPPLRVLQLTSLTPWTPIVMAFQRWGMNGATARFRTAGHPATSALRAPHEDDCPWPHPDADLIAHAPSDLAFLMGELAAVESALAFDRERVEPGLRTAELARAVVGERDIFARRCTDAFAERIERPTIVCLCGSTRFGEAFRSANLGETLAGRIVLSIGCDTRSDDALGLDPEVKPFLDELHLRKVDLADEVLILNAGGHIGESTRRELGYARAKGKTIRFLEEPRTGDLQAHEMPPATTRDDAAGGDR
jgi:hypothetical protein